MDINPSIQYILVTIHVMVFLTVGLYFTYSIITDKA